MAPFRRILFPTDFSQNSRVALPHVRAQAASGAEVVLLHVLEPVLGGVDLGWSGVSFPELDEKREESALQALESLAGELRGAGLQVQTILGRGKTWEVISRVVEEKDIELVVLATHGHRGLSHLLLGSTAEMVVRTAPCPVLTVKSPLSSGAEESE